MSCLAQICDGKYLRCYFKHYADVMAVYALVGSRFVILCLGVSLLFIFVGCNVFKIVLIELLPTSPSTHTPFLLERLHWLPSEYCYVFKTVLLVYKFLQSGHPKYFELFLKPRHNMNNTCKSQADGVPPEVPHFATSVCTCPLSIVASALLMMLQRFRMICQGMYIQELLSTHSERSSKPISL